ncbi:PREDICTED: leucine-rich repeat receptor-like protein kinase PXC1 isoform X2 [Tarenaya hassleriana]|uniref:leucine-rich repeat receptor-like protein kinase PXC1 isoform X1 n=1 Tax=Tarenaya hassleriana TaxID=28532 RepID=UPI00053C6109|nr:PREDICTED: leucine-rich repeat receptor-like protein kinase PXC1 isoform X1 [Tarenaya hassleriana]XP_010558966.1 PREDICTED: leucine-rich repeat receptor-like protein kinase PXC1 isoform X2 [Tarenaya hassleriana]
MAKSLPLLLRLLLFPLIFVSFASSLQGNDTHALTLFRLHTDTHGNLAGNWTGADACSAAWRGVVCSPFSRRVTSLSLPSLSLRGPLLSLSLLDQLRLLDVHDNRLNGTVLPLTNCTNLRLVYLSGNDLSGEIPPEISTLKHLIRLDLSDNNIRGVIPTEILGLTRVLTIRVQSNVLTGRILDFSQIRSLLELNVSYNELYGRVPDGVMKSFGDHSFAGNEGLCGSGPLPACPFTSDPESSDTDQTIPSNPTSVSPVSAGKSRNTERHPALTPGAIAALIGGCVAVLIVSSFTFAFCCGRRDGSSSSFADGSKAASIESGGGGGGGKRRSSYGGGEESDGTTATDRSRLVFFERRTQFELEDLLRASAEMLGKGSLGTVYKAVLDDGSIVAVKRLKDANPCPRKEFEQYMEIIGRLKHPNVVKLRAYYYAKEEKLLVYDYLPNGSLHSLLHGNRGPGRIPLDWTTRIGLILGAARGLAKIHDEYSISKIPHGNIKSSNVLLDKNGVTLISDFGLSLLLNPVHAISRLGGYRAPEQSEIKHLSQKSDVYSFGVLILEVLTGKAPSLYPSPSRPRSTAAVAVEEEEEESAVDLAKWVRSVVKEEWTAEVFDPELLRYKNIEDEMVTMLHIGLSCVMPQPEKRPTMAEVVKMVEELRVEQSPVGDDYDESRSSLSPSMAATEQGHV